MPTVTVVNARGATETATELGALEFYFRRGYLPQTGTITEARQSFTGQADQPAATESAQGPMAALGWHVVTSTAYGGKGDRRVVTDGVTAVGSATLTSASASFTPADVGKTVSIPAAGTSGGTLFTTIASRESATTVTLSATATAAVTGAQVAITTDDTAAIQAAIDAASLAGGTVYLPAGEYLANVVLKNRVTIRGAGRNSTIRSRPNTSAAVIGTPTDATKVYAIAVKDLQVNGNRPNGATGDGVNLSQTMGQPVLQGDTGLADPAYVMDNVTVAWAGRDGIGLSTGTNRGGEHLVSNCYVFGSGRYGMYIHANDCKISNTTVGASAQHGIFIDGGANQLTGCKSWYAGYDAVAGNEWTAAQLKPNQSPNNTGAYDGIHVANAGNVWGTILTGCQTQDNGRYGLCLNGSKSVKVAGHNCNGDVTAAIALIGGSQSCDVDAFVGHGDRGNTATGLVVDGSTTLYNRVRFGFIGSGITGKYLTATNGGSLGLNDVALQTEDGLHAPTSTTTTMNMDPANYGTIVITLDKNTIIGPATAGKAPAGARLTVILIQNATGNFTVTWNASFRGAPTVAAGANLATAASFVNISTTDTPSWVCTGSQVGI